LFRGKIPSMKLLETETIFALMDIDPLSKGHSLIIPKFHAEFMHQVPDHYLGTIIPTAKRIALAAGWEQYNILQNNGKMAHQAVPHVHFHMIPKPNQEQGLSVEWKPAKVNQKELLASYEHILRHL
ncbi:putative Hit family protein 1, partial [Spinellus fusiger]